jgi:multiple sugar transport system permease protein
MGLLGSPLSIILPALFGQGVNSAIFILIYRQFFSMAPKAFDEAAEIDGAGELKIFFNINLPLAAGAILTTFLFSFVWYWNETYISGLFLEGEFKSLQIRLLNFTSEFSSMEGSTAEMNEGVRLAATLLIILPMLIVYLCLQRYFIEGVERSGIAGE